MSAGIGQVFTSNVHHLVNRIGGQTAGLPAVELWYGGEYRPMSTCNS